ncbi:MAG: AAA family ATPase [Coriobacteriales bacterium]|nr:AAA family ATPase [Coriobacteriales bacterium]
MILLRRKLAVEVEGWLADGAKQPLLIRGARRTGKTTLAETIGRQHAGEYFVKLDFQTDAARADAVFSGPTDDLDRIVSNMAELLRTEIDRSRSIILLDEVQLNEKALNSLRFFSQSGWRIIATGSLLGVTVKWRRLPFPSGIRQVTLHPMDFEEWLWACGEGHMANAIREHAMSLDPYILHDDALELYHRYLVVGGMPKAVATWVETRDHAAVRSVLDEIDLTYTADMTDPENGISGAAAKRVWESIPKQLMRASTKKFKYAEVVRGGRRASLLEPLEWLDAAGIITLNHLTCDTSFPLAPYNDEEGSFFKAYVADTGLMFRKFRVDAETYLDPVLHDVLSSDFRGALAENSVMQALCANGIDTYYWMPQPSVGRGEVDFVYQTNRAQIVPVEVKSGRNVRAKSLAKLVREGRSTVAYRLSEQNFSRSVVQGTDCTLAGLPLYAAYTLDRSPTT